MLKPLLNPWHSPSASERVEWKNTAEGKNKSSVT